MKLHNLQILRGISALLVCCFHLRESLMINKIPVGEILFGKGSIGVPIFFIISGFIMVFTTKKITFNQNTRQEITSFFKKRLIRIVPLYYLLTFAWIVLGGSIFYYFEGLGFKRLITSLLFLPQKETFPVLYLGWSLNYEIFFYLIFGLSFIFKTKRYLFIIMFFIATYLSGLFFNVENTYLKLITSHLNLYFIMGIVFGLYLEKFTISKKAAYLISSAGIVLFCLMIFKIIQVQYEIISLLIVSLFVLSFLCFDYTFQLKGNRYLIFLGDISYSLYLSHSFVEIMSKKFITDYSSFSVLYFVFKLIVILIISSLLYFFVEKKLTAYLKVKLKV